MSEYVGIFFEKALPPLSGLTIAWMALRWAFWFISQIVPRIERLAVAMEGLRTQLAIVSGQPIDAARDSNVEIAKSNPGISEDS